MDWRGLFTIWKLTGPNYKRLIPAILYVAMLRSKQSGQTGDGPGKGEAQRREAHSPPKLDTLSLIGRRGLNGRVRVQENQGLGPAHLRRGHYHEVHVRENCQALFLFEYIGQEVEIPCVHPEPLVSPHSTPHPV